MTTVHDASASALPDVSRLIVNEASTPDDAEWHDQHLHVLVLSNAGKPLFSLHGDESKLAGLTAVAQALISVVKDMDGDMLRVVRCVQVAVCTPPVFLRSLRRQRWVYLDT